MSNPRLSRPARVLIVDDNPGDAYLMQEAFAGSENEIECTIAADGAQALAALQAGSDADGLPDLMILDLNMPKVNGFEVLQTMRDSEHFKHVPVVVMTSSTAKEDVLRAYRSHASSYIEKPVTPDEFFGAIAELEHYWLELSRLPSE